MRLVFISIAFIIGFSPLFSQVGGTNTYEFLDLTNSARIAALGGKNISLPDNDLNLSYHNPALLNSTLDKHMILNYVNYFSDINYGYASYSRNVDGIGNIAAGIQYINYGDFIAADEKGIKNGHFKASEYALNLIYSKKLDSSFSVGVNVKPIFSALESYRSFGIAADLGAYYHNDENLFSAGLVVRNIGTQIWAYTSKNYEPLPFEIQLGMTKKLLHAPFRFSITAHQLQNLKMTYTKPVDQNESSYVFATDAKSDSKLKTLGENMIRHIIFGLEILPSDNFNIRLGYNYQRRKELQLANMPGAVGFSWGFGVKFTRFEINFGRATYHLAGASNHFSLTTDLGQFYRKENQ